MSEKNFLRLFPSEQGYRYFLIEAPNATASATVLEERLSDFGFDAQSTEERLASFHRVENTYLSTFQLLGGLGLAARHAWDGRRPVTKCSGTPPRTGPDARGGV